MHTSDASLKNFRFVAYAGFRITYLSDSLRADECNSFKIEVEVS